MTAQHRLRLVERGSEGEPLDRDAAPAPVTRGFTRTIVAPAALPWRQRQAADLDARHGSPLPLDQVAYQLRRLDPWRAGHTARFAIIYERCSEARSAGRRRRDGLQALGIPGAQRGALLAALGLVGSAILAVVAITTALDQRQNTASDLAELQRRTAVAERKAAEFARRQHQDELLEDLGASERSPAQVLKDLAWVTGHKRADVVVTAFHWQKGVSAIEAASADAPFQNIDRQVQRGSKRLRLGTWIWGVGPASASSGISER